MLSVLDSKLVKSAGDPRAVSGDSRSRIALQSCVRGADADQPVHVVQTIFSGHLYGLTREDLVVSADAAATRLLLKPPVASDQVVRQPHEPGLPFNLLRQRDSRSP